MIVPMLSLEQIRNIGRVIEAKARKVLDCENALRPAIEQMPTPTYSLTHWCCHHCRRPYRYSITQGWLCKCRGGKLYGGREVAK